LDLSVLLSWKRRGSGKMALKLTYNNSFIEALSSKAEKLLIMLQERMTLSMTKLQERARENLAATRSPRAQVATGALSDSVSNPRATVEGNQVIGRLDWGKDVPYAKIQEYGGRKAQYAISPIGVSGVRPRQGPTDFRGSKRYFSRGRIFAETAGEESAGVLQFTGVQGGSPEFPVYRREVFRKALQPRMFMHNALDEMRDEIKEGLRETIMGSFEGE
jgi:hypothetical protein